MVIEERRLKDPMILISSAIHFLPIEQLMYAAAPT